MAKAGITTAPYITKDGSTHPTKTLVLRNGKRIGWVVSLPVPRGALAVAATHRAHTQGAHKLFSGMEAAVAWIAQ